jgi:hypothetical protein
VSKSRLASPLSQKVSTPHIITTSKTLIKRHNKQQAQQAATLQAYLQALLQVQKTVEISDCDNVACLPK